MSRKMFFLAVGLLVILMTAGCFDLFAVPGVVVSSDGSQVYFLVPQGGEGAQQSILSLSSLSLSGGQLTAITTATEEVLTSAFAVNPTNGDLAYVQTDRSNGTHLMIVSGGNSREIVGPSAFGSFGIGTMMRFSPDGSRIALTMVLLPPEININELAADNADMTSEQLANVRFVLYLVNVADGSLTPIGDGATERINTIAWSPSGKLLAYNSWTDSNGDGNISTLPNLDFQNMATDPGDTSQIHIYSIDSGNSKAIESTTLDYAPAFLSDSLLAYASLGFSGLLTGTGNPGIMVYDTGVGSSKSAYTTTGLVIGVSVSPDGQKVAWVESGAATPSAGETPPGHLYVSGTSFQEPVSLMDIPSDAGLPDAPVWTPDGKSILMTSTGIFSSIASQASATLGGGGGGVRPVIPVQKIVSVDTASGSATTIYEGPMANSSIFASLFGLISSGALDQLGGALGQ